MKKAILLAVFIIFPSLSFAGNNLDKFGMDFSTGAGVARSMGWSAAGQEPGHSMLAGDDEKDANEPKAKVKPQRDCQPSACSGCPKTEKD